MHWNFLKKKTAENYFEIHQLWSRNPFQIGIFDLKYEIDADNLIDKIYEFKEANPKSFHLDNKNLTHVNAWRSVYQTHKLTNILDELIIAKTRKIKFFIKNQGTPNISDIWINMYQKQDYASRHSHGEYGISTVYYPKVSDDAAPLIFDNNDHTNYEEIKITPKSGMLLVFHSLLNHRVPKIETENTRISIAGNFRILFP